MRATIVFLGLVLLAAGARASENCEASPEVDTGDTPVGRYYVDNDPCQPDCLFSVWVYQESNGEDGLQRHDQFDDCSGAPGPGPDTLLF